MVVYGLTLENEREITGRAATKKDGVYKFRGVGYRVVGGRVTHYACNGKVLERCFGFNCVVGKYDGSITECLKLLKSIV